MKSWEVLREATDRVGAKAVAARLNLSVALIYKWCQEPASDDPDASGARNPLDRVKLLFEITQDPRIINWVCNAAGGFFAPNPPPVSRSQEEQLLGTTQRVVQDFGQLLSDICRSIENDGLICSDEARTIRRSWEQLKMQAESFVVACEQGRYSQPSRR